VRGLKTRCSIGYAISENPDAKRLNLPQTVADASGGAKMHQNRRDKNAWFF
jgi:hypothetical protein